MSQFVFCPTVTDLSQSRCLSDEDGRLWLTPMIHCWLADGDKYL